MVRYGLNRHRRRHIDITSVCSSKEGVHIWTERWTIKGYGFRKKVINNLNELAKIDYGNDASIVSIATVV